MGWQNNLYQPGDLILGSPSAFALAAGATLTLYNGPVTAPSYAVFVDTFNANGGTSAKPFTKVSVIWKDAVGGNTLDLQQWFTLQTNVSPAASNALVCGRGPTTAGFVTVLVKNMDTVNAVTVDAEFLQSLRTVTRHDWRNVSNNISGTYTAFGQTFSTPVSATATLFLGGSPVVSIPASGITARIHALYAGEAQFFYEIAGTSPLNVSVALFQVDPDLAASNEIYLSLVSGGAQFIPSNVPFVSLPRCPVILVVQNNDAVNPINLIYSLMAQEFAS